MAGSQPSRIPRRLSSWSSGASTPRQVQGTASAGAGEPGNGSCVGKSNMSRLQRRESCSGNVSPRSVGESSVCGAVEDAVKVIVRVRPMNERERNQDDYRNVLLSKRDGLCGPGWNAGEPCVMVTEGEDADVVLLEGPNRPDPYTVQVDRALGMESGQEDMFEAVGQPMVDHCMDGFNSTIFAYGQTGSGKTYTMMGEILRREDGSLHAESGLIPRVFDSLFTAIEEKERGTSVSGKDDTVRYSVKCSFLEIYNEEITDLLDPSASGLQIRDGDTARGVYVQGLSEKEVLNADDVLSLISSGSINRTMASTKMNERSSRSHTVFTATIEAHRRLASGANSVRFSKLNLIDLAGSERVGRSGATGEQLTEARSINKSLTILGRVITALVDRQKKPSIHVPYRDSRLTFLLQESLGGNSRTAMVATVTPAADSAGETYCTLAFAAGAKKITCRAVINEDRGADFKALQAENARLLQEIDDLRTQKSSSQNISLLERNLEQSRALFDQNNVVIATLRAEQSVLQKELVETKASAARAIEEASTFRASNVSLSNAYEVLEEENSKLSNQVSALVEEIEDLKGAHQNDRQRAKELASEQALELEQNHSKEVENYRNQIINLENKLAKQSKSVSRALEVASEAQTSLHELKSENKSLTEELQEANRSNALMKEEFEKEMQDSKVLKAENASKSRQIEQLETNIETLENKIAGLEESAEAQHVELSSQIENYKEENEAAKQEIEDLKSQIAKEVASVAKYKRMVGEIGRLVDWAQTAKPGSAAASAAMAAVSAAGGDVSRKPSPAAQAALRVARMSLTRSTSPLSEWTILARQGNTENEAIQHSDS